MGDPATPVHLKAGSGEVWGGFGEWFSMPVFFFFRGEGDVFSSKILFLCLSGYLTCIFGVHLGDSEGVISYEYLGEHPANYLSFLMRLVSSFFRMSHVDRC